MTIAERTEALERGQAHTDRVLLEHGRALGRIDKRLVRVEEGVKQLGAGMNLIAAYLVADSGAKDDAARDLRAFFDLQEN